MNLSGPVGRDDYERGIFRTERAEFWNSYLKVGEHLEEKPLELLVCAVELVDEQHWRPPVGGLYCLE